MLKEIEKICKNTEALHKPRETCFITNASQDLFLFSFCFPTHPLFKKPLMDRLAINF